MIKIAILIFLIAAAGGLFLAFKIFTNKKPPMPVALLHGVLAASGLGVLGFAWLGGESSITFFAGSGLLVIAALGGFFLFTFHVKGKAHPKPVVAVHAVAAVAGVGTLLLSLL